MAKSKWKRFVEGRWVMQVLVDTQSALTDAGIEVSYAADALKERTGTNILDFLDQLAKDESLWAQVPDSIPFPEPSKQRVREAMSFLSGLSEDRGRPEDAEAIRAMEAEAFMPRKKMELRASLNKLLVEHRA